jgi:CubicO group peptidase (beta-lactamase class C family)
MRFSIYLLTVLFFSACNNDSDSQAQERTYFPPIGSNTWENTVPASLGWNIGQIEPLLTFLEQKNTKAFIILYNGKIVMEHYFNGHQLQSNWYWASAGKTLTAAVTGIAMQEGFIDINQPVSSYLGTWTSLPAAKELNITSRHLLSMSSGISDVNPEQCVTPECLTYLADAGSRWAYHNVYVKLQDVVAASTGVSFQNYFNTKLRDKIGMNGTWLTLNNQRVYWSSARSMARFGLLMLNRGKWENQVIVNNTFCQQATNTSQNFNPAYGYFWWLNGKSNYMLPQTQWQFAGSLIPTAPSDMIMALGKNDQKIYIVPSRKLVIIRMGEAADEQNFSVSAFDNNLWQKLNAVIR